MELELKRGGRTARVETLGGELVSYRDERGWSTSGGAIRPTGRGAIPCCFPLWGC